MKTSIKTIAALMLMSTAFTFQSCKDDDDSKNTAEVTKGHAVITGKLTADLVLNNGKTEGVSGITVTGSIDTRDLVTNPIAGANYARKTYTATTNADGVYRLVVDASVKSVNVNFNIPESFTADQTLENGTKQRTVFTRNTPFTANVAINNGQTIVQDAGYTYDVDPSVGLAKFTGTVMFRNDLCRTNLDSQLTVVPNGTIIVATWVDDEGRSREIEVTTGANGKFEFSVETANAAKTITLKGRKFTANLKELELTDCITKANYEYVHNSVNASGTKNETTKIANIIFE